MKHTIYATVHPLVSKSPAMNIILFVNNRIFLALKLSTTTGANLLATNSNHHYVKCIDIYPKSESDLLLAIGQANGRVTLSTFGPSVYDTQGLTGKDLGK